MDRQEYKLQILVSNRTRARLILAQAIIDQQRQDLARATWSDVVEWLAETVPLPQLLAELCGEAAEEGHKEKRNDDAT